MPTILRVDASARYEGSSTRRLADQLIARLQQAAPSQIILRDLASEAPEFVNQSWVFANFTDEADRSAQQQAALAMSDALIAELEAADTVVIAAPIYNFSVPAVLKAWIDMVARARKTFRYTENGPQGLLTGKKAYIVIASGGTPIGSDIDFASGYLKHIMGFIGITDVTLITAARQMADQTALDDAIATIDRLELLGTS